MFTETRIKDYTQLNQMLKGLIEDETDRIANLSNASSLLNVFLEDINWVGFYLYDEAADELVLGPFQGLPACVRIQNGKGVCGLAFRGNDIFIVDDVTEFPGHIACDANSRSEIVVPIYKDGTPIGVLDIDSPTFDRFTEEDRRGLSEFVEVLKQYI
ncbi:MULTISPECIES: GAF domain-containing protein [Salinicoccus]|jgi:GAF domain-containing protein|uniref:GAF domain-containing protein n=1 Tax=Salinicoccus roseus TaxID=45670 RepID=A0A0C2HKH0_9STAP|nr:MULTISPECIES: GAF domain-containing protein [Salinicoccus]KIH70081.1 histidine kinase [Salinicoccus roseus]MBY8909756.1 GAF domain-containing protein [Salinicoccus roseus]MCC4721528.1 GAF domain-containing protein [Salinicoccus sp. RF5]MDB0581401.1 GAF domain-containing protein [Salinicoccus roseus]OZT77870.1 histidine kinase [Salinicoccus roseus]